MSLPGGFSGRRFWGTKLVVPEKMYPINVETSTELHIAKAILQYSKNPLSLQNADSTVNIFVRYLEDHYRSRPDNFFAHADVRSGDGNEQELRDCLVCSLNPQNKREADLDLNFVAGKRNLTVYFQFQDFKCVDQAIVNLSGYVVGGGRTNL